MRINTIEANNLFGYSELFLDLSTKGRVLVLGQNRDAIESGFAESNGAGKTALLDIISWVLFGETPRGIFPDEAIRSGSSIGWGQIVFQLNGDIVTVYRRRELGTASKETVSINDENFTKTKGNEAVSKLIGMDFKVFLQVAYLGANMHSIFLESSPKERLAFLSKMIPSLEVLDGGRWAASHARKLQSAELDVLQVRLSAIDESLDKNGSIEKIEEIKQELSAILRGDERRLSEMKAAFKAVSDYDALKAEIKILASLADEISGQIETFTRDSNSLDTVEVARAEEIKRLAKYVDTLAKEMEHLDGLESQLEAMKAIATDRESQRARYQAIIESEQTRAQELSSSKDGACPISGIETPKVCAAAIESAIKNSEAAAASANELMEEAAKDVEKFSAEVKILDEKRDIARKGKIELNVARDRLADLRQQEEKGTELRKEIQLRLNEKTEKLESINSKLSTREEDLNEIQLPSEEVSEEEINKKETEVRNAKVELATLTKTAGAIVSWEEEKASLLEKIREGKKSVETSEFWETGFPRLKFYLLEEVIGKLENLINSYLEDISPSMSVKILTQREAKSRNGTVDGINILISSGGDTRRLATWSSGENRRVILAFFAALHHLISSEAGRKLDFLLLDEVTENLDHAGQKCLVKLLETYYSDKMILCISHDDNLKEMFPESITVVKEDGISRVGD